MRPVEMWQLLVSQQVGYFGYVAFCDEKITGDILLSFRPTIFSEAVKLGFVIAVAMSFPLVIFPLRAAIFTLVFFKVFRSGRALFHS